MKGWVYVITNEALPHLVKVGFSMKDPAVRAGQLNHTGTPHPYRVEYDVLVENPRDIERAAHSELWEKREGKEWFRCSVEEAVVAIRNVVAGLPFTENYRRASREQVARVAEQLRSEEESERVLQRSIEHGKADIMSRYASLLASELPNSSLGEDFAKVFICAAVTGMALSAAFGLGDSFVVLFSLVGSAIATPLFRSHLEVKAKDQEKYKRLLRNRDAELAAVESRARETEVVRKEIGTVKEKTRQPSTSRRGDAQVVEPGLSGRGSKPPSRDRAMPVNNSTPSGGVAGLRGARQVPDRFQLQELITVFCPLCRESSEHPDSHIVTCPRCSITIFTR